MSQDLQQEIDKNIQVLVLVSGVLESGTPHWAYAAIPLSRYESFKRAETKGHYDLGDFGKIIADGSGREPDADTIAKMRQEYGADHKFEEEIGHMVRQIDKALDYAQ